jgi:hypothetical protein
MGDIMMPALFDTGASRSIIAEDFAQVLLDAEANKRGSGGIVKREDLALEDQLPCLGIQQGSETEKMKRLLTIDCTFSAARKMQIGSKRQRRGVPPKAGTKRLVFAEVGRIQEPLLIGAPDCIDMGFKPDWEHIELHRLGPHGLTIPRVLNHPRTMRRIQLVQAYTVDGRQSGMHMLQAIVREMDQEVTDDRMWLRPTRDTALEGYRVIEQPLNQLKQGGNGKYIAIMVAVQGFEGDLEFVPGDEPFELVPLSTDE